MNEPAKERKQVKRASSLLPCSFRRLLAEDVAQIKDRLSHFKRIGLKVSLPISNNLIKKKNLSQLYPALGLILDGVKLTAKTSPYTLDRLACRLSCATYD